MSGPNQKTHDKNLRSVFERLIERKLARAQKIDTIKNTTSPQNVSEVKSFVSMARYVSRFTPGYENITVPLRSLTKQKTTWKWGNEEHTAFKELKDALIGEQVM